MPDSLSFLVPALAAALVAVAAPPLAAQELITVDRAVQDALAHNASLRAARASGTEAEARVAEAKSGWFPRVTVTETWQRGDQPVFVFSSLLASRQFAAQNFAIDALNHPDATGFFRNAIGVEQLIFDGGRQRSIVARAESYREIARLQSDEASAATALATVQTSGRIVLSMAGQRAARAALEAARGDLGRAQHRRDAGTATDADVLALAAHVADLEQQAIQHEGDAAVARAELNRLTGAPIARDFQVAEPSEAQGAAFASTTVEALLSEAGVNRPELRRAAAAEKLADADRRSARAAFIPQVAAQGGLEFNGTQFDDRASAWLVGAEVRWSFSIGGAELARTRAAAEAATRAAAAAEDARAAVQVDVVTALRRLQTANARRAAGRAAVDQAGESLRITRDRFDAGLASATDVLRASSAAVDAEARRVSAAVDAVVAEAMLRRALGRNP
jgi:outer membrane protein TolC